MKSFAAEIRSEFKRDTCVEDDWQNDSLEDLKRRMGAHLKDSPYYQTLKVEGQKVYVRYYEVVHYILGDEDME